MHNMDVTEASTGEYETVRTICDKYKNDQTCLIQILLEIQAAYNWLPKDVLLQLQDYLQVPLNRIYEVTTFYKVFSLIPRGKNLVKICTGTACHVRRAPVLIKRITQLLGINPGETTPDMLFTMETVGCLGCCALGPVVLINDDYYSNPTTDELKKLFVACS